MNRRKYIATFLSLWAGAVVGSAGYLVTAVYLERRTAQKRKREFEKLHVESPVGHLDPHTAQYVADILTSGDWAPADVARDPNLPSTMAHLRYCRLCQHEVLSRDESIAEHRFGGPL